MNLGSIATTTDGGQTWTCNFCREVIKPPAHSCDGLDEWGAQQMPPAVAHALDAHADAMAPEPLRCPMSGIVLEE